jgi:hypothetical protein
MYKMESVVLLFEKGFSENMVDTNIIEEEACSLNADECKLLSVWITKICILDYYDEEKIRGSFSQVTLKEAWVKSHDDVCKFRRLFTEKGTLLDTLDHFGTECIGKKEMVNFLEEKKFKIRKTMEEQQRKTTIQQKEQVRINLQRKAEVFAYANVTRILEGRKKPSNVETSSEMYILLEQTEDINWSPTSWAHLSLARESPCIQYALCHKIRLLQNHFGAEHGSTKVNLLNDAKATMWSDYSIMRALNEKYDVQFSWKMWRKARWNRVRSQLRSRKER